jgi:predicted SAM-dependent methyltransferase
MMPLMRIPPISEIRRIMQLIVGYPKYFYQYWVFQREGGTASRFSMKIQDVYPCLTDSTSKTWFDRHYVYHTAWAARKLIENQPKEHVDISSSLYFSAIVSSMIPVHFFDYRPVDLILPNLESGIADLTALEFDDSSVDSLSCMHVVEHIGMGRYGDPIDYDGDRQAMSELQRVLRSLGRLLLVVPIGRSRIEFNAHRIYSYHQVINAFDKCRLIEFSLILDDEAGGGIVEHATEQLADSQRYGCGLFVFQKN